MQAPLSFSRSTGTMKSAMIAVLLAGLTLVSGVSAMAMTDDTMMMKDDKMMSGAMDKSMMKDTMMKDNKMMMSDDAKMMAKKYIRMSTAALAKTMGYTWSTDRTILAEKAGITAYKGTIKQNLMIRTYLMGMMKDKMAMKDGAMMKDTMAK
jgi:hypothetical protein